MQNNHCHRVTTQLLLINIIVILDSKHSCTGEEVTFPHSSRKSQRLLLMFIGPCIIKLCISLQNEHHPKPAAPNLQHTTNWEQDGRCGNSTTQSQAPDEGYINVRNMLNCASSCASACKTNTTQNQPHQISNTQRTENKTVDVVIQQHSRKLLKMDILMSETCWAHKKWNKIASDIKLVSHSSTITMMHDPINVRFNVKIFFRETKPTFNTKGRNIFREDLDFLTWHDNRSILRLGGFLSTPRWSWKLHPVLRTELSSLYKTVELSFCKAGQSLSAPGVRGCQNFWTVDTWMWQSL